MWSARLDDRVPGMGLGVKIGTAATLALAVGLAGCSANYVENSQAAVLLIMTAINTGAQLDSDIRFGTNTDTGEFICEDEVPVALSVQSKNPSSPVSAPNTVLLTGYQVRYTRSDGRATEGVDVPYTITGTVSTAIPEGGSAEIPIEVVRRQAKLEPPLSNVQQAEILTVNAEVTVFGTTISGEKVSASGFFQIDFADFGDTQTECPAQ
jgi:hypothetical protein